MQVKITFSRAEDKEDEDIIYLFIDVLLERIDELLLRTPDYVIRGRHKITLTFYGLSKEGEAEKILKTVRAEIVGDGLIERVTPINSSMEEDTGPYRFIQPEYKEGVKEDLESKKGYGLDVQKLVGEIVLTTIKTLTRDSYKLYEDSTAPLSTMALVLYDALNSFNAPDDPDDPEEVERYLTEIIANEPMYREPGHKRPRKPRRPRTRSRKRRSRG